MPKVNKQISISTKNWASCGLHGLRVFASLCMNSDVSTPPYKIRWPGQRICYCTLFVYILKKMTKVGVHRKHGVFNASKNQFLTGKIYSCHVSVWETSWIYILPHHVKEYLRPSLISCSSSQRGWSAKFIQIGLNLKIMYVVHACTCYLSILLTL